MHSPNMVLIYPQTPKLATIYCILDTLPNHGLNLPKLATIYMKMYTFQTWSKFIHKLQSWPPFKL